MEVYVVEFTKPSAIGNIAKGVGFFWSLCVSILVYVAVVH